MKNKNQDRLSILPDNLLFIIISFLPFKEAVRTSILSRRWRSIPQSTRNIEFNERDFVRQPPNSEETRQNERRAFVDFVMGWIGNYQDSGVDKFRLAFSHPEDHLIRMEQCIGFAIGRKVQVLDLDFSDPTWNEDNLELHNTFLELTMNDGEHKSTIESLKLFSCNPPAISQASQNFSALKSVYLGWITVTSSDLKILLAKCPTLDTLSMKKCSYAGYMEIIGPSLKTLVLERCSALGADIMLNFFFNAPNLRLFKYSGILISTEFEWLRAMEEAELDFGLQREYGVYGDILYRLLVEIACVRTLSLCTYMLQVITNGEEPLKLKPALGHVQHLILKTSLDRTEFYGITFFLNSCPNLEQLTFDLNARPRVFPEYDPPFSIGQHTFLNTSTHWLISYSCLKKKLKSIVVEGFKGQPNELVVLGYLLKFARHLDSLYLNISNETAPDGTSLEATYLKKVERLLHFEIASKGIKVFISRA